MSFEQTKNGLFTKKNSTNKPKPKQANNKKSNVNKTKKPHETFNRIVRMAQ